MKFKIAGKNHVKDDVKYYSEFKIAAENPIKISSLPKQDEKILMRKKRLIFSREFRGKYSDKGTDPCI